jgi:hypothetical protein
MGLCIVVRFEMLEELFKGKRNWLDWLVILAEALFIV